jgi:hypothetical protein
LFFEDKSLNVCLIALAWSVPERNRLRRRRGVCTRILPLIILATDANFQVTQCPIPSGSSFLYDMLADEAGTFWYHSHLSIQYCDGLRGVLVVYDPADPHLGLYDFDNGDYN